MKRWEWALLGACIADMAYTATSLVALYKREKAWRLAVASDLDEARRERDVALAATTRVTDDDGVSGD